MNSKPIVWLVWCGPRLEGVFSTYPRASAHMRKLNRADARNEYVGEEYYTRNITQRKLQ